MWGRLTGLANTVQDKVGETLENLSMEEEQVGYRTISRLPFLGLFILVTRGLINIFSVWYPVSKMVPRTLDTMLTFCIVLKVSVFNCISAN